MLPAKDKSILANSAGEITRSNGSWEIMSTDVMGCLVFIVLYDMQSFMFSVANLLNLKTITVF